MELNELLNAMDRTAANLAKLEAVWSRARNLIAEPWLTRTPPEYDDLCRSWRDLLAGLPPINGWRITAGLPDFDELSALYREYGALPPEACEANDKPGKDLAEYKHRLSRARSKAVRSRLEELTAAIDVKLPVVVAGVPRDSMDVLSGPDIDQVSASVIEIQRLMGDTERHGRWSDLARHMRFSQGHDWHDIREFDWPSVRADIEAADLSDSDPLPIPDIDLGTASAGELTGAATIALPWERLDDAGFERLLYDLLRNIPEYHNVQLLTKTRAADRGRDLSLERMIRDSTGSVRNERVIVQAKHWLKASVQDSHIADNVAKLRHWEPPVVRGLIIATSGHFTQDAVAWAEKHNESGQAPYIDLWSQSKLETLLAQKPHIAAAHGLK